MPIVTSASVKTLKGITDLLLFGNIIDAWELTRKLRDNLLLEIFLLKNARQFSQIIDDWDNGFLFNSKPSPDEKTKIVGQTSKSRKAESPASLAIDDFANGELENNGSKKASKTKRDYFSYSGLMKNIEEDNELAFIAKHFSAKMNEINIKMNDFVHGNNFFSSQILGCQTDLQLFEREVQEINQTISLLIRSFFSYAWTINSSLFHSDDEELLFQNQMMNSQYCLAPCISDYLVEIKNEDPELFEHLKRTNKYGMEMPS